MSTLPSDITDLRDQLDANEAAARALVDGITPEQGVWRPRPNSWSIAECLDHLGTGDRVYLQALRDAAEQARSLGRMRRGPARAGWFGTFFIWTQEPARRWLRLKAPRKIRPRVSPPLESAYASFMAAHADARALLLDNADLDLAGIHFVNPFVRGFNFSLATGLHVIAAHERRHLLQARRVREALPVRSQSI